MQVRTYIRPASLADALHTLATVEEPIAIIAGGTDVLVYAREDDRYANSALIDIYGLAEELGFVGREVSVSDLLGAIRSGKLRFCMTSATQSNSGASAYIGFLLSLIHI